MPRLLLVDDEPYVLQALKRVLVRALADLHVDIETCTDPLAALARAEYIRYDVTVSDYRMPSMDGVSFLKAIRQLQPDSVRLVLSATTDSETLMAAINEAQIHRYLVKPWNDDELTAAVREAIVLFAEQVETHLLADKQRVEHGRLSPQELELRRLEAESPGITKATWGPDGELLIDEN